MKKIEQWLDFDKLSESPKKAVSEYYYQQKRVEMLSSATRAFGISAVFVALLSMFMNYELAGDASGSDVYTMIRLMWAATFFGFAVCGVLVTILTHARLKERNQRSQIAKQFAIDVDGLDLVELKMEHERRA